MQTHYDVLIIGTGHGGSQAAIALRQAKFPGSIALVGAEPELPYERPPLSKDYLSREKPFDRILIRPPDFWAQRNITLLPGRRADSVAPQAHQITTDDGVNLGYGQLIWATGGAPRRLTCTGHNLVGVHNVRNRRDIDLIVAELPEVTRVVVIGGGYIGLEIAAVLTNQGKQVTILEALTRVLSRVAGEPLSRFYEGEHRSHGVSVCLEAKVDCIVEENGKAAGVRLTDGTVLKCEMVIVGIGIAPAVDALLNAGAEGGNGVRVDAHCRTSLPHIFAIGDCALHANRFADGARIRVESVQNATDQAQVVAKAITGTPVDYNAVPWFWSNQYDLQMRTVGLSTGHDQVVVRGDPADRSFSVVYLKAGRVIALDCVNAMQDYVQGRALVLAGARPDAAALAAPEIPLKQLV